MPIPGLRWVSKHPRVCVAAACVLMLLLLICGSKLVSAQRSKAPSVIFLTATYKIPPVKLPIPDRWIPQSWGWLWRVKEAVLGKAKVVNLDVAKYELDSVVLGMQVNADPELGRLLNHVDFANTNGQKVWLLPNSKIRELQKRFSSAGSRSSFRAGISTADRCQASLMTTDVTGVSQVDTLPLVRAGTTELTVILTTTTPIAVPLGAAESALGKKSKVMLWPPAQTNAVAALRLQLPANTGFFLLDSQRKTSSAIETAVLITVERPTSTTLGRRAAAIVKRAN